MNFVFGNKSSFVQILRVKKNILRYKIKICGIRLLIFNLIELKMQVICCDLRKFIIEELEHEAY